MFKRLRKLFTLFVVISTVISSTPLNVLADTMDTGSETTLTSNSNEVSTTETTTTSNSEGGVSSIEPTSESSTPVNSSSNIESTIGSSQDANAPSTSSESTNSDTSSDVDKNWNGGKGFAFTLDGDVIKFGEGVRATTGKRRVAREVGTGVTNLYKEYGGGVHLQDDYVTVNGQAAFCIDPSKAIPYGVKYARNIYEDEGVYNILYWGTQRGWAAPRAEYLDIWGALNIYLGSPGIAGKGQIAKDPNVAWLLERARVKDAPKGNFDFTNKNQVATWNPASQRQETNWYTPTGGGSHSYTVTIPSNILIHTSDGRTFGEGSHVLLQNTSFKLSAPASYTGTVRMDVPTSAIKRPTLLLFQPSQPQYQRLAQLIPVNDPIKVTGLSAEFHSVTGQGKLAKVDENGNPVANAQFEVKNVTTGEVGTLTTDSNGMLNVEYPDGTKLEIRETKAPYGFYRDQQVKRVTIQANQTANVSFTNMHQKGKLILTKGDAESGGTPQGNAVLDNAVYALYKADGTFVQNITFSGRTGVATNLDLGEYYLQEVKAPTGYALDKRRIDVTIPYAGQDVKISVTDKTVTDRVVKGSIKGWKFGNKNLIGKDINLVNGNGDIKNPLQGVEITARSYTTGIEYKAVTDNNGYFEINNLPYDRYQLVESKGKEGYRLIMPFDFEIRTDGVVHQYLLEDKVIENKVKVVKQDAVTGRTIPIAGVQFKIFDTVKGEYIRMLKPNSDEYSEIFETNADGYLVTSDTLLYGKDRYRLEEVQAPYRYTKGEPITFSVDSKGNAETVVVIYKNVEQTSRVVLTKTVEKPVALEVKSSSLGAYKEFKFAQQGGQGFEFKIRAAEDIVKPEGTLVYHKGDFVKVTTEASGYIPNGAEEDEVITTNVNGRAVSYPKVHKTK